MRQRPKLSSATYKWLIANKEYLEGYLGQINGKREMMHLNEEQFTEEQCTAIDNCNRELMRLNEVISFIGDYHE